MRLLWTLVIVLCVPVFAQDLNKGSYKRIRDHILPNSQEEGWRGIPWKATYWDAVIEANEKDKPILFWAMNGHPLACT